MRRRWLALVAVLSGIPCVSGNSSAWATDKVIARDPYAITTIHALGDVVLYSRALPRRAPRRLSPWMRVIAGRARGVRGLPAPATRSDFDAIGRDEAGRVVMSLKTWSVNRDRQVVGIRWWLYDVARDVARPLRGLPRGPCAAEHVSVWGRRLAYVRQCRSGRRAIFLRERHRARRVSRLYTESSLLLRGNSLAVWAGSGDGETSLWRVVENGRACPAMVLPSESSPDDDFAVKGAWLTGRRLTWWMESATRWDQLPHVQTGRPLTSELLLQAKLAGDCMRPGATGSFRPLLRQPRHPEFSGPMAVDGRELYYSVKRTLYRRRLPARASTKPPPNDDVADAERIVGGPPVTTGVRVGYATRQSGEPPVRGFSRSGRGVATASRTVWYVYRPVTRQRLFVYTHQWEPLDGALPAGALGVFEGSDPFTLSKLPPTPRGDVSFEAAPGRRYWIAVGCDTSGPCYPTFWLTISREPRPEF